jgi:single-stranded DNA-binding protein
VNPITVTVTGRLGADPRTFTLSDNTPGVELRLAVDLPPRGENGRETTRWVKVTAYGLLATRTAASVRTGDRVTVIAEDLIAEAWIAREPGSDGKPRAGGQVTLRAREIAASMRFDTLTSGYADRKAARLAAANGEPNDLPAGEQADARVLSGVTAS